MDRIAGAGDPDLSIVVCLHGDEKRPKDGVMDLYEWSLQDCPVQMIVGNPKAIAQGTRFVDEDLNRCFPGMADGKTHVKRPKYTRSSKTRSYLTYTPQGRPPSLCTGTDFADSQAVGPGQWAEEGCRPE
jgi:succinylglutamate desuccinylase